MILLVAKVELGLPAPSVTDPVCTNLTRGGASACRECDGSGAVDLAKATALNLLAIMRLGSLCVAALLFCVIAYNVFPNMR